ncbi:DUF456 domain-containing protein [Betaproteobacteria bacterium PRO7]|jgi:uncharacterized protein YqgC (DUF456 family)|nr:DUF456 domain-containing protein [Burkholderiaceae bacterium]MDL1861024.1 DUF456 domain-containing protein [Betaproteobacteria bacterium PRO7]GIL04676.1 MAG: membrane protein [Betaproteobacteria bacterium]
MTTLLWVLAVALILVGIAGTVLPALPGVVFVFGGIVLAAWIDDFARISGWTVGVLAVLAAIGFVVDYVAGALSAQRAGATRLGLLGAALGTVAGVVTGLWGLVFMPLAGAAIGEFIAHRDALRAGRVGVATWIGLLVGAVAKLAIVFTMVGVFVAALLI